MIMAKTRVTVTLDEDVVERLRSRFGERNVSHAVNAFVRGALDREEKPDVPVSGAMIDPVVIKAGTAGLILIRDQIDEMMEIAGKQFGVEFIFRIDREDLPKWKDREREWLKGSW